MAKGKKYYVVWVGRNPGVYDDWSDAQEQITQFQGARYKSFATPQEAAEAYRKGLLADATGDLGAFMRELRQRQAQSEEKCDYRTIPDIDQTAWAVDASCQGNPGIMEYQGINLATGECLFRVGPFHGGTNNIGEFLAIVHALALMEQRGESHTIYSDSRTAISWILKGKVRTTLTESTVNAKVFNLLRRALKWLLTHQFRTRIVKWDTDNWGEIPADFGRK